ncbi:hypothetical protein FEP63_01090 [Burkholderia multivorans]|nr:hypothetical protein Bmul_5941 [Burkholderia multivorans ATCC 17616]AIO71313.1 hypothetical protein DM80_6388 [Burkholderia multivorans]MDR8783084.1 hypothetical protein [Burkholderia multivorans]MDR8826887.1 hypothetical protein [Burkholderia multivorans]MDR8872548.1 hypothetical protein [Burkholderia multivorans]
MTVASSSFPGLGARRCLISISLINEAAATYTSQALTLLATQHGLEFGSFSPELHVAFERAAVPGSLSTFFR